MSGGGSLPTTTTSRVYLTLQLCKTRHKQTNTDKITNTHRKPIKDTSQITNTNTGRKEIQIQKQKQIQIQRDTQIRIDIQVQI